MSAYELVKTLHILSAALIFGTGLGSAFTLWRAYRLGAVGAVVFATRYVVLADWLFTLPAIIFQPLSGFWLAAQLNISLGETWMLVSLALYLVAGACWLPVVWLQIRLRRMAEQAHSLDRPLPVQFHRYMKVWFTLGWPAFLAVIAIFYLMVAKP